MTYAEIPGFAELKARLRANVLGGRLAHAQLFFGPQGGGQWPMARAFAQSLLCPEAKEGEACGACSSCRKAEGLVHPDIHVVVPAPSVKGDDQTPSEFYLPQLRTLLAADPFATFADWVASLAAENKQLAISVAESRRMIRTLSLKSHGGERKVVLLWLPELMHPAAANALLKLLEEPPAGTVFLLVSDAYDRVLGTIQSRTQKVHVGPFAEDDLTSYLVGKNVPEPEARAIARRAEGNLPYARELAAHREDPLSEQFITWLRAAFAMRPAELVAQSEAFQGLSREGQKHYFDLGLQLLREVMHHQAGASQLPTDDPHADFARKFATVADTERLMKLCDILSEARYHIERNGLSRVVHLDTAFSIHQLLRAS